MKSTLKRFLSLVLCMFMVMALLPNVTMTAFAASSGTVTGLADENIGLSFTGDADDAWSANGTSIIGTATSTSGACDSTNDYSSTLTIANKKATTATLSFDYTIEQNSGTIQVDGTVVSSGASFTKELAANESVKVYIKSGSTSAATKITLTNVALVSDVNATATFVPAENGTYTVDGKPITEVYTHTQSSMTAYQLEATPAEGYRFKGWYDVDSGKSISTDAKAALNFDSNRTITARFVSKELALFETGGQVFDDLNDAVAYAQANGQSKITLATDGSISGTYTIPAGITLLIPFDEAGTLYTTTPAYTTTAETQKAYRTLTMAAGSSITVNGGAISVGGKHFTSSNQECCKPTGAYGLIKMQEGSSIMLNNGANLYAWGYITGDGSITANSGANVYEYYQVTDWRGGSQTGNMANNKQKVFPFTQYYVQNIEAALTLNAGANEYTYISVTASFVGTKSATIPFVGSNGLFKLGTDGQFTKRYIPAQDRMVFTISGEASLNSIAMSVATVTVDSKDYVLPINNNVDIVITSGTTTIEKDAALLPGVTVLIAKGAELKVASAASLYVYDDSEWSPNYVWGSNSSGIHPVSYSPSGKGSRGIADVKVDVNGVLTVEGAVYTTATGANITSSEGTGKYAQVGVPGTSNKTYQFNQNSGKYIGIDITPAKLHNADGSYTETATANAGDIINYVNGVWGGTPCAHENTELRNAKEATCTEDGYTGDTYCKDCGETIGTGTPIPAKGHSWNEGKITTAPTCENAGVKTYTCTVCNATKTEAIDATGHAPVAVAEQPATCTEAGHTAGVKCSVCGATISGIEVIPATGHKPVIRNAVEATLTTPGYTGDTYCSVCNEPLKQGKKIPKTGAHITWVIDGKIVAEKDYLKGTMPSFEGSTDKAPDENYRYTFTGWSPEVVVAEEDATYTARYSATARVFYTITFNANGGEGSMEPQRFEVGVDTALNINAFTRENYKFNGWNTAADGSGATYADAGAILELTGDMTLYAQWQIWNGWFTDVNGKQYYQNGVLQKTGWTVIDGKTYYLDTKTGYAAMNGIYWLPYPAGYGPDQWDIDNNTNYTELGYNNNSYFIFDAEGVFQNAVSGFYTVTAGTKIVGGNAAAANTELTAWAVNGELPWHPGLVICNGAYYYFTTGYFENGNSYICGQDYSVSKPNDLAWPSEWGEGTFTVGKYTFDADGKLQLFDGFTDIGDETYYYVKGVKTYAGLIQIGDDYYYVNSSCKVIKSQSYTVSKTNGLLPAGTYDFDDNGKMIREDTTKNGIVKETEGTWYYYVNGVKTYAGLIQIGDDYYYVNSKFEVIHGRNYFISKTNGLMEQKTYYFDAKGKLVQPDAEKNGIVKESDDTWYYYVDGVKTYAGLIQIDGNYYYVNSSFKVIHNQSYYVSKTNGWKAPGTYEFDADGKMVIATDDAGTVKNGIVKETEDTWYYYVDGTKSYAGLIVIDGSYYYVNSKFEVIHGRNYFISKTNGLLANGTYTFDEDGKMNT